MTARLEQRGIPAARGGKWSAVQVGCCYLLHDRDAKYTQSFREIIASGQVEPLVGGDNFWVRYLLRGWGGRIRTSRRRFAEQPINYRRKGPERTHFHPNRWAKRHLKVRILSAQSRSRVSVC
jgi:hypothetical protein